MKLDRTTYEAWLLDRLEGNLTPVQERELEIFLAANPDLSADVGDALPAVDDGAPAAFDWKSGLKKRLPPTGMPDAVSLNEFLVARLEGDLDKTQELALDKFLYEHPGFEQEVKRISASKVDAIPVHFGHKSTIERHFPPQGLPDKHRLTDFLIASREGDLTLDQQRALTDLLASHPEARRDERLVAAAKVPAERVVFAGKEGLKKREGRVIILWQRYAVAASIALLLGFAWWMMRPGSGDGPAIARTDKPKVEQKATPVEQEAPGTQDSEAAMPEAQDPQVVPHQGIDKDGAVNEPATKGPGRKGAFPQEEKIEASPVPAAPVDVPVPEPQLVEAPVPEPPAQELAQQHVPEPHQEAPSAPPAIEPARPAMASVAHSQDGGIPIGTLLANTVRGGVLATDPRPGGLDGDDALAMANKAIGAVTGGKGHVDVGSKGGRSSWKLRLGQHLAISASTGR